jgi:tRNA/rRNA methyltransferase
MSKIIILSHPQMGENIGATARVMSNFGLDELRMIAPRDGWPNPKAYELAANGAFVLDKAKVYPDNASAIADLNLLYGAAASDRFMVKDSIAPWSIKNAGKANKVGFLFGCERTGLSNDELVLCDHIIKIPTSELNPSLNLAQAVSIVAYEMQKYELTSKNTFASPPQASKEDIIHMLGFLENSLEKVNFFRSPKMKPTMMRNIGNLFIRAQLNEQDIRTLYGIFKALKNNKTIEGN